MHMAAASKNRLADHHDLTYENGVNPRNERIFYVLERAKRLSMREERARLIAEGKEIPPELIYTGTSHKYKDGDEDSDDSR